MRLPDEIGSVPGVTRLDTFTVRRVEEEGWRFIGLAAEGARGRSD